MEVEPTNFVTHLTITVQLYYWSSKNPSVKIWSNKFQMVTRRVSCHQKVNIFNLVFQFLTVWAETLHDNRTSESQQSYVFGFLILTVFGAKMTS